MSRAAAAPAASAPESLEFDSAGYADDETAFEAYARLYSQGADVRRAPGRFLARVHAWRFDRLILFDRRLSGLAMERGDRVSDDGFDHFTLTCLVSGALTLLADGRRVRLAPGEGLLLDMRRRMGSEPVEAHVLTVSLQRPLIEAAAGSTGGLHGRRLEAGPMGLLHDFLLTVAARGDALPPASQDAVAPAVVALLTAAVGGLSRAARQERRALQSAAAAEALIRRDHADPEFDADVAAERLGLSRATLYRLFRSSGGVARRIDLERLTAMRRRLERGDTADMERVAQEAGFVDAETARRASRRLQGLDVERFRADPDQAEDAVTAGQRRWAAWMSGL